MYIGRCNGQNFDQGKIVNFVPKSHRRTTWLGFHKNEHILKINDTFCLDVPIKITVPPLEPAPTYLLTVDIMWNGGFVDHVSKTFHIPSASDVHLLQIETDKPQYRPSEEGSKIFFDQDQKNLKLVLYFSQNSNFTFIQELLG